MADDERDAATAPPEAELDALQELGDEIATLAAHIHAATQRLLVLIAEFDRRRGWELDGHRSCAHWLSFRTGIDLGAAREKVRTARALESLPATSVAMARGELSFSQVRALTRVATADGEGNLLQLARGCTVAQLERLVRSCRRGSRADELAAERERYESRTFSVFPDDEGMYVVRGKLPAEVGALLMRAIEVASAALYAARGAPASAGDLPAQRRADAVGLLVERALATGLASASNVGKATCAADDDGRSKGDVAGEVPRAPRAARYEVVLHVDAPTLAASGEAGRSELEDGTRVSAETSRRLACDAGLVQVTHDAAGAVLDVGRRTRTVPPALRRALEVRDRGCRFPGCGSRFADAHHVVHWADGGATSLANTLLLCRHHHRLVHEGGWRVAWWGEGQPVFIDPRGGEHFNGGWRAPRTPVPEPRTVPALVERAAPHLSRRWRREVDIPDEVLMPALEALG